jgi:hypothetical protein
VTDYGDENPLLMDYFGFPQELYQLKFKSRGDSSLSQRIVNLYKEVRSYYHVLVRSTNSNYSRKVGIEARTSVKSETRGRDGRGFHGDHRLLSRFGEMVCLMSVNRAWFGSWRVHPVQNHVRSRVSGHTHRPSVHRR